MNGPERWELFLWVLLGLIASVTAYAYGYNAGLAARRSRRRRRRHAG